MINTLIIILIVLYFTINAFQAGREYVFNPIRNYRDFLYIAGYLLFFTPLILLAFFWYCISEPTRKLYAWFSFTDTCQWIHWNIFRFDRDPKKIEFKRWSEIKKVLDKVAPEEMTWRNRKTLKYINFIFAYHNYKYIPDTEEY